MRTIVISLCLAAVFIALGHMPSVAYASPQSINYVPLAPIDVEGSELRPGTECKAPTCFPRYLRTIYNVGIALAGLFAVVSIVRGGFELMFTDSILGRSEGKAIILRALGGLVIVYSSYILMNAINPALGRDLDLALQFPRVDPTKTPPPLTVVTAADVEAALNDQITATNAQIRALTKERDAKIKLAAEKRAAAGDMTNGLTPTQRSDLEAEADTLQAEAATLDEKQRFLGDVIAPSERIKNANFIALNVLWEANTTWTTIDRTATKQQRIDEANRQLLAMEAQRARISLLSDTPEKTVLLKELDDTKASLAQQIEYFKKDCNTVGQKEETYWSWRSGSFKIRLVPCPQ